MLKKISKNIIFTIIFILIFANCSNIQKNQWHPVRNDKKIPNVKAGDILIKEKELTLHGIFGHAAIMEDEFTVVDYPLIGKSGYKINIRDWLEINRNILILRYKGMNKKFKNDLIKNIKKYSSFEYKLNFNKKNNNSFYCSQYIWYLFYITAEENGFYLDIDKDKGFFIFPYDLINKEIFNIK